jgi:hypothetical protein
MTRVEIDWVKLEAAFENHAPHVHAFLDRENGEVVTLSVKDRQSPDLARYQNDLDRYQRVDPVPSRDQYTMMEAFIETVTFDPLKALLKDAIVGKGAFRRFKDTVARHPEERKRWFAFRDVLLHRHVLEWMKNNEVEASNECPWSLQLPEPGSDESEEEGETPPRPPRAGPGDPARGIACLPPGLGACPWGGVPLPVWPGLLRKAGPGPVAGVFVQSAFLIKTFVTGRTTVLSCASASPQHCVRTDTLPGCIGPADPSSPFFSWTNEIRRLPGHL